METNRSRLVVAFTLSTVAACGGGGGSGSGPIAAPANLAYPDTDLLELSGVAIAPVTPAFQGQVDAFVVEPALPAGLVIDPETGVLSGSPSSPAVRRTYTITAQNAGGSASAEVAIEVAAPQRFAIVAGASDRSLTTLPMDGVSSRFLRGGVDFAPVTDTVLENPIAHPNGRFVYAPSSGANVLRAFGFDESTGALEPLGSVGLGAGPHAVAVHPGGEWLLVANRGAGTVLVYALDELTGAVTFARTQPVGTEPSDMAFTPDGAQVFVAHAGAAVDGLGSSLAAYAFDAGTSAMTISGAPLSLNGGRPIAIAVDPHDPYVYLALSMFDAVLAVRTSTPGALVPVPPLRDCAAGTADIEIDARGLHVYAAAADGDQICAFRVDGEAHDLVPIGTFPAGDSPERLHRDALGQRVFAVARASRELLTYAIQADGSLDLESALALRSGSVGLAFVSGAAPLVHVPRFVHCANEGSDDIHAFRVDAATGALTLTDAAFTDDRPASLAIDPRAWRALVLASGARTLQAFDVASANGALSPTEPSVLLPGTPAQVALEPAGRFAYVATKDVTEIGDGFVLTYAIDPATGELALVDQREAGASSGAVAVDPTGEFLYVANAGDGVPGSATIAAFRLDPATGIPAAVGTPVAAPGVIGLAFHPDAKTIYAVLRGADALARYTIDRTNGSLTAVPPASGEGFEPSALAVDPRGRYAWAAYTGNASPGQIDVLPIAEDGGLGSAVQQVVDGAYPTALAIEASGRFLYAANRDSNDISILAVDPVSGFLAARVPALAGTAPGAIVATGGMQ